ncbi:MAG: hypothetical protein K940chlam7_01539 [Chlamydiae bacterium]|nr:hypothetical protein [Chlamydiota bacterium]
MHYFIDGYNLMFRVLHVGDDLQSQREQIILDLNEKIQFLSLDVTIVFDAQYQYGGGSRSHLQYLEICFTDEGETADDYIISAIKASSNPRAEIVITSDKKLAWRARRHLAKTEAVDAFLAQLNKRYRKIKQQKGELLKTQKTSFPRTKPIKREKPVEPVAEPSSEASPEQCFQYYLYQFEKKYREKQKDQE